MESFRQVGAGRSAAATATETLLPLGRFAPIRGSALRPRGPSADALQRRDLLAVSGRLRERLTSGAPASDLLGEGARQVAGHLRRRQP